MEGKDPKAKRTVTIMMTNEVVESVDKFAKDIGMTRSGFIEWFCRMLTTMDKTPVGDVMSEILTRVLKKK